MEREKLNSRLEEPKIVRLVAGWAGIDTIGMTDSEITEAVIKKGHEIIEEYKKLPPNKYRSVPKTPFTTPLANSVAILAGESARNPKLNCR